MELKRKMASGKDTAVSRHVDSGITFNEIPVNENVTKEDGPWVVVQKSRRPRKGKQPESREPGRATPTMVSGRAQATINGIKNNEENKGSKLLLLIMM